jgi:hypothetical protein
MDAPFYFKYISIDNYEDMVAELQLYILKYIEGFGKGFHLIDPALVLDNCPIFSQWIATIKSQIRIVGIIISPPYCINDTHRDYIPDNVGRLALNMEIQNCRIPKTKLYLTDTAPSINYTPNNEKYWKYDSNAIFTEIGEFDLTQPVLFDTQTPHQVFNQTSGRRISISFRFFEDPVFDIGLPPTPTSL